MQIQSVELCFSSISARTNNMLIFRILIMYRKYSILHECTMMKSIQYCLKWIKSKQIVDQFGSKQLNKITFSTDSTSVNFRSGNCIEILTVYNIYAFFRSTIPDIKKESQSSRTENHSEKTIVGAYDLSSEFNEMCISPSWNLTKMSNDDKLFNALKTPHSSV